MKPILLKIKGLNNFEEEETINFERLIKNGLFGIFGPTGSGKSTIIDAITISLYGEMSRFKGDKRAKNFINVFCDSAYIYFKFSVYREKGYREYIVERSYKKMKDVQKLVFARLYFYKENKVEVLADNATSVNTKIKEILGLSYEDFLKSVILPQGKFSDFLLLANKERRDMLERIFSLENYGESLVNKIKYILNDIKNNLKIVESKLDIYKDINEEFIKNKNYELENINNELKKFLEEEEKINIELEKYKNFQKLYIELNTYEKSLEELLKNEDTINNKKIILNNIKKAKIIKPLYEELKYTEKNIENYEEKIKNINISYNKLKKEEEISKLKFEKFKFEKENNYPILIKKEAEIKNIIDISKAAKKINLEIKFLREEYKKNKSKFTIHEENILNIEKEIKSIEENILNIEKEKKDLEVNVDYRDNVVKGLQIENNIKQNKNELENIKNKINKVNKEIEILNKQKIDITKKYNNLNENINVKEENLNDLYKIPIIDEKKYNEEKEKIYNMEKLYNLKKETYYEKENLENKYKDYLKEYKNIENNYEKRKKLILNLEEKLNILEEKLKQFEKNKIINKLIKSLKEKTPCPVCGSLNHPEKIPKIEIKNENYTIKIENLKNNIKKLKLLHSEDKIKKDYINKYLNETKNKILVLEDKTKNINIKEEDIENEKEKLNKSLNLKNEILKNIEIKKEEINILKNENLILHNETIIKEELIKNNKKLLKSLILEEKDVLNKINNNNKILKKLLLNINNTNFLTLDKEIKMKDIKRLKIEKDYNILKNLLLNKNTNLKELEKSNNILKNKIEELNIIGKEKKETLLKYNEIIKKVCKNENNIETFLNNIQIKIKYIEEEEEKSIKLYNNINYKITEILDKKKNIESKNILLKEIYIKKEIEFKNYLIENNFLKEENFKKYLEKDETLKENEIKEFEYKSLDLSNNINRVKEKLKNSSVKIKLKDKKYTIEDINKKIENIIKNKESIKEKIILLRENKTIYQENIKKIEIDFKELKKAKKEELILNSKLDDLEDLYKLFECKKFVEYIAKKQLAYLVKEASKNLKDMTKGRYAIELDDVEFIIRDDFNGGIRRSPKTLSGGETFITSLCLALALSSKIQLKNKSPIELFFLDEGFGTLDEGLLDIVIENLIKLQSQKINIGVISHIEEVKTRMPIKLILNDSKDKKNHKIKIR